MSSHHHHTSITPTSHQHHDTDPARPQQVRANRYPCPTRPLHVPPPKKACFTTLSAARAGPYAAILTQSYHVAHRAHSRAHRPHRRLPRALSLFPPPSLLPAPSCPLPPPAARPRCTRLTHRVVFLAPRCGVQVDGPRQDKAELVIALQLWKAARACRQWMHEARYVLCYCGTMCDCAHISLRIAPAAPPLLDWSAAPRHAHTQHKPAPSAPRKYLPAHIPSHTYLEREELRVDVYMQVHLVEIAMADEARDCGRKQWRQEAVSRACACGTCGTLVTQAAPASTSAHHCQTSCHPGPYPLHQTRPQRESAGCAPSGRPSSAALTLRVYENLVCPIMSVGEQRLQRCKEDVGHDCATAGSGDR